MKKRILSVMLALVLCLSVFSVTAFAAEKLPDKLEAPSAIHVRDDASIGEDGKPEGTSLWVSFNKGSDLGNILTLGYEFNERYGIDHANIFAQLDWSIDNQTDWQYRPHWDKGVNANDDDVNNLNGEYVHISLNPDTTQEEQIFNLGSYFDEEEWTWQEWKSRLPSGVYYTVPGIAGNEEYQTVIIDWSEHTLYVKMRFYIMYWEIDSETPKFIFSDWSPVTSFGKNAVTYVPPTSLETPVISNLSLADYTWNDGPVFLYKLINPQSVKDHSAGARSLYDAMYLETQVNIGDTGWVDVQGASGIGDGEQEAKLASAAQKVDNDTYVQLRARYHYWPDANSDRQHVYSEWSNVVQMGAAAWGNASEWATEELRQADEMGLIPETLQGADLTQSITRAEFAAVSVKAYEALAAINALPNTVNPFTDTNDVEVLKAYNLGITAGVSADKFEPGTLLNREQAATMLTRTFKRATMNGWTIQTDADFPLAYEKPAPFADDDKISDWAKDSVYFMAANGIINGVGDDKFAPQNTTTEEQATGYANATREQALIIATRMVKNLKK